MNTIMFSVSYKSAYKQEADEVRCPMNQLGLLLPFIKENPTKRYNISVNKEDIDTIIQQTGLLTQVTDNYTVNCGSLDTLQHIIKLGCPAYLKYPVTDWETYNNLRDMGVSDIIIDGPLGFCGHVIRRDVERPRIRVFPTGSPNAAIASPTNSIKSFYIRPEDLDAYDFFVNVIEFKAPTVEQEDAQFSIYKRGSFMYNINELIPQIKVEVLNPTLSEDFGKHRVSCQQVCMIPGYSCHLCSNEFLLANKIIDYFKKDN